MPERARSRASTATSSGGRSPRTSGPATSRPAPSCRPTRSARARAAGQESRASSPDSTSSREVVRAGRSAVSCSRPSCSDGDLCQPGRCARATWRARRASLLTAERTALNFLQHLSGIATLTRRFVDAARRPADDPRHAQDDSDAARAREIRGAMRRRHESSHRVCTTRVLIKDNHIRLAGGVGEAVRRVRAAGVAAADRSRGAEPGRGRRRRIDARRRRHHARQPRRRDDARGDRRASPAARASRSPAASRSSGFAAAGRRLAPTACRSARSRTRRRPPTSAWRSRRTCRDSAARLNPCRRTCARAIAGAAAAGPVRSQSTYLAEVGFDQRHRPRAGRRRARRTARSVLADSQRAGRGRRGREWFSPPGAGVYLSVDRASATHSRARAVARDACRRRRGRARPCRRRPRLPVELKWPNDVVIGRPWRKLGGLLCESVGGRVAHRRGRRRHRHQRAPQRRSRRNWPIARRRSRWSSAGPSSARRSSSSCCRAARRRRSAAGEGDRAAIVRRVAASSAGPGLAARRSAGTIRAATGAAWRATWTTTARCVVDVRRTDRSA